MKTGSITKFSLVRIFLFVVSGILFLVFFSGVLASRLIAGTAVIALFLGITNFGRQCPLLLSVRHHINRIKEKNNTKEIL